MIAQLRGILVHKNLESVVIDCHGVGYVAWMSLSSLQQVGELLQEVTILVHTQLSQDALRLYGFVEHAERQVFEVLLGTTGVGPRLALAILSALSPAELADAVSRQDKGMLTRIAGVGAKKAARLLLELQDRLPKLMLDVPLKPPGVREDLLSALVNLGFSPVLAQKAAEQALQQTPNQTDLSLLVRAALRATTPR